MIWLCFISHHTPNLACIHTTAYVYIQALDILNDGAEAEGLLKRYNNRRVSQCSLDDDDEGDDQDASNPQRARITSYICWQF